MLEAIQAMMSGKFALLNIMNNEDRDIDSMTTIFNTAVSENSQRDLKQASSENKQKNNNKKTTNNLGHSRNSWAVRQKETNKKEKIPTRRIWEIQESDQQHQEVNEKGKRKLDRRTV